MKRITRTRSSDHNDEDEVKNESIVVLNDEHLPAPDNSSNIDCGYVVHYPSVAVVHRGEGRGGLEDIHRKIAKTSSGIFHNRSHNCIHNTHTTSNSFNNSSNANQALDDDLDEVPFYPFSINREKHLAANRVQIEVLSPPEASTDDCDDTEQSQQQQQRRIDYYWTGWTRLVVALGNMSSLRHISVHRHTSSSSHEAVAAADSTGLPTLAQPQPPHRLVVDLRCEAILLQYNRQISELQFLEPIVAVQPQQHQQDRQQNNTDTSLDPHNHHEKNDSSNTVVTNPGSVVELRHVEEFAASLTNHPSLERLSLYHDLSRAILECDDEDDESTDDIDDYEFETTDSHRNGHCTSSSSVLSHRKLIQQAIVSLPKFNGEDFFLTNDILGVLACKQPSAKRIVVEADLLNERQLSNFCHALASPSATIRKLEIIDHENDNNNNNDNYWNHQEQGHTYNFTISPAPLLPSSICIPLAQALLTNQSLECLTIFPSPLPPRHDLTHHLGLALGFHPSLHTLNLNLGHYNETYLPFLFDTGQKCGGGLSRSSSLQHVNVTFRSCFYSHMKWQTVLLVTECIYLQKQQDQQERERQRRRRRQEQQARQQQEGVDQHDNYNNETTATTAHQHHSSALVSWSSEPSTLKKDERSTLRLIAEQAASIFAASILPTSLSAFAKLKSFSMEGTAIVLDDAMATILGRGGGGGEHLTSPSSSLRGLIGTALLQSLAQIINDNNRSSSSLEHVTLNLSHMQCPLQSLVDFFLALKSDCSLKSIELDFLFFDGVDDDSDDDVNVSHKLIQAVTSHMVELKGRFLTDQKAFPCYYNDDNSDAEEDEETAGIVVPMMQDSVVVVRPSKCLTPKIKTILQGVSAMNRAGRNYILDDDMNKEKGIRVLASVSHNLDCLFLHLLENPFLCHTYCPDRDSM